MRPTMCQLGPRLRAYCARAHWAHFLIRQDRSEAAIVAANGQPSLCASETERSPRWSVRVDFNRLCATYTCSPYMEAA